MTVQKELLTKVIKVMFLALGLGFIYVLFSSISGPSKITSPVNLFDDVQIGQTAARRSGSIKVWATRLSALHRQHAAQLNDYVTQPDAGCAVTQDVCAVLAATQRSGIEIIYSKPVPQQLKSGVPWHGGFVDPSTGEVFDRLGRAYKLDAVRVRGDLARRVELQQL